MLYYTTLYYYYTTLYYTILYYTILYYTILYYTILYYTIGIRGLRRNGVGSPPTPSDPSKLVFLMKLINYVSSVI